MRAGSGLRESSRRQVLFAMVAAVLLITLTVGAWAEQMSAEMTLSVGGSKVVDFQNIKRAAVSDPSVADYVVLSAKQIMLSGKAPGATDFYLWDDKGQHKFRIIVTTTPAGMDQVIARIQQALARPGIRVTEHNGVVVLEGEVETPTEVERAGAIAAAYVPKVSNLVRARSAREGPALDVTAIQAAVGPGVKVSSLSDRTLFLEGTVTPEQRARLDRIIRGLGEQVGIIDAVSTPPGEPHQILVHVKVVDIDRVALSEIGVNWGGLTSEGRAHDQPILFGEVFTEPTGALDGGPILRLEGLSALVKALVTANKARILAEPNLLVTEGNLASILVGGEIPIPVVQSVTGIGGAGSVTVEWKEFGVKLAVKGTIGGNGKSVDLQVSPEVSSLDFANSIVVSGIALPALRVRKAQTVLHVDDGQTLVIGGLYQTEWTKNVRGLPILSQIPVLGHFFKRTDRQQRDTELVIFVTPEILTKAAAAAQAEDALKKAGEPL